MTINLYKAHLVLASKLIAETWQLLDKGNRSLEEDERMLSIAFASYYHNMHAGMKIHRQRGEYMIARVCLALDKPQEALDHARRCMDLTEQYGDQMEDLDIAFAYEIFARANTACGHVHIAREYWELARNAGNQIEDDQHREIFYADLNSSNWFHMYSRESSEHLKTPMLPQNVSSSFVTMLRTSELLEVVHLD